MSQREAVEVLLKQTDDLLARARRQIEALTARGDGPRADDARIVSCEGAENSTQEAEPRPRF